MTAFALAFIAGLVTIFNPCVLPLIPILLASSLGKHRFGPIALAFGLVASFTIFGFTIIAFGFQLGIREQAVRQVAGWLLVAAGAVLLFPRVQAFLTALAAPLTGRAGEAAARLSGNGLSGQFAIGLVLGLVWAPCVGPTLGAAIAAASRGEDLGQAFLIFLTFALGVAISIAAFAAISRRALREKTRHLHSFARVAKPLFGIVLILVGLSVVSGIDKAMEAWALERMPLWLVQFTTGF